MKFKKILPLVLSIFILAILVLPNISFAQQLDCSGDGGCVPIEGSGPVGAGTTKVCDPDANDLGGIVCKVGEFLKSLIPLIVALGMVYFIWGVVQYMIGGGEEAKTEGRNRIIYGLIGFAIIAGMWGLVTIVVNTFGLTGAELAIKNPTSYLVTATPIQSNLAGSCNVGEKLQGMLSYITCLIGASVIPFIFALATGMFLWGILNYFILGGGEEEKRTQGKQFMIWGIIALVVMISIWGIVKIAGDTFGLDTHFIPKVRPN
jgi:hypothetical protein